MPPGRSGRVWLQRRLGMARQSAGLLQQKLQVLRAEQSRYALLVQHTAPEWERSCREAETWLLRGALLGGQRAVQISTEGPTASVAVTWRTEMGTRHPDETSCTWVAPLYEVVRGTALNEAAAAYRTALEAGARHGAAEAALEALTEEVAATAHRLRAVEQRWLPRLEGALRELELQLDEAERVEGARLRWALREQEGGGRR